MNNIAASTAALTAPGMFYCANLSPGPATLSECQCIFNQARFKAHGFPHSCSGACIQGAEVRRKHQGEKVPVVQFNILQGGFVASNTQTDTEALPPVCPAKRIAREKKAAKEKRVPRVCLWMEDLRLLRKIYHVSACGRQEPKINFEKDPEKVTCGKCREKEEFRRTL